MKDWLPILGWFAIPLLNYYINSKKELQKEYNTNIEEIETLFTEMNKVAIEYFSSNSFDIGNYYKLIALNNQLRIYIQRISILRPNLPSPNNTLIEIKQITTDDRHREKKSIGLLISSQIKLLSSLPKDYRILAILKIL